MIRVIDFQHDSAEVPWIWSERKLSIPGDFGSFPLRYGERQAARRTAVKKENRKKGNYLFSRLTGCVCIVSYIPCTCTFNKVSL